MNNLKTFVNKCFHAYEKMLSKEQFYEAWTQAIIIKVNDEVQEDYPLIKISDSKRERPYVFQLSDEEFAEYKEKVQNYLELERSLSKMKLFGSWVSFSGLFSYDELQEILDLEAMQEDSQQYLDKHLHKFPLKVQQDVQDIVRKMNQWKRILEYL